MISGHAEGVSVPGAAQSARGEQRAEQLPSRAPNGAEHVLTNAAHRGSGTNVQETVAF